MTREEEIKQTATKIAKEWYCGPEDEFHCEVEKLEEMGQWADEHPKNPWIINRNPEIKGTTSDAVLLLIDGMFYKVSRLERRKDGTEFWWGVDLNNEEVDAWMPIPSLPKGGEK